MIPIPVPVYGCLIGVCNASKNGDQVFHSLDPRILVSSISVEAGMGSGIGIFYRVPTVDQISCPLDKGRVLHLNV